MTMRTDLYDLLSGDSGISAAGATGVFFTRLPQNPSYPVVSYQVISNEREGSLSGGSRIFRARVQIDVWGRAAVDVQSVSDAIRTLLDGNDVTQGGTRFASAWVVNESDLYEDQDEVYRVTSDYEVRYWST
jgi:hypothetical protein